ncbi:MAG: bifunctional UDP-N-acetylglucosamine diphosphorylase/glucosamine-1-phosphate N-acetyltransferase GlmU [Candidatus Thiosymbion ectosymbiont of Robbea hypermnestra]|nr:bifunctional UDP-N-acetylglucosamine diphosphorylase/glucosamine-1-phosphate N-acetyltransferase GlmU [Candidatus Thiosymbion ectosymbiont of Robbea hypermnestra]
MKLGVVVLAAGQGKRMRSRLPKVLHPLAGRPLLAHALDTAQALGAARICVVYGHGGDLVPRRMADYDCVWVEQAEQQGTGHAVRQAMPSLQDMDRILVLYGDVPLMQPATLQRLVDTAATTELGVLTAVFEEPTGYGRIVRDETGRVLRIVEQRDATQAEQRIDEINTGFLVADRARLDNWLARIDNRNAQGEYYLTDILALAVGDGVEIATSRPRTRDEVCGVNDRVQLATLERIFQRRQAEDLMRNGVTLADPARLDIRGRLHAGEDVSLDVNLVIEGNVRLAAGVSIGPNCLLRDCEIGPGTQIFANSVIEGAVVGADARIGPFARLRPEAVLADAVHVGNFVELKKSQVGEGSKVNHLTYVGDARIGRDVNVGAGTITCNYDGVNKHPTVIGDRAFIGSNASLVAPVEIGEEATVGAGSVISHKAPDGKLSLTRARQTTVEHWHRPRKKPKAS